MLRRIILLVLLTLLCSQAATAHGAPRKASGTARFRDGEARSDRVIVEVSNLPQPPGGSHYQSWLGTDDGGAWVNIGTIPLRNNGSGKLEWVVPGGENLIARYSRVVITIEGDGATNQWPSPNIALQGRVAGEVIGAWRALTVSGPDTPLPSRPGLAVGLKEEAKDLAQEGQRASRAMRDGKRNEARNQDEALLNRLAGINDGKWGDWDRDGKIEHSSDSYGITRYATTIQHVVWPVMNNPAAPEISRRRAASIMASTNNLLSWAEQTRNLANVVAPDIDMNAGQVIQRDIAWLTKISSQGADLNGDGDIKSQDGEGGASDIYSDAQDIGRMELKPLS